MRFVRRLLACLCLAAPAAAQVGYYQQPAIHDDMIIFVAEGDLWKTTLDGGVATRLTTHHGDETHPVISPDGRTVAFLATYEGPREVYTMPVTGGLPTRQTYESGSWRNRLSGWTPDGDILLATQFHSTLPDHQLVRLNPENGRRTLIPLAQAAAGAYDPTGEVLYFTRLPKQGSHTKRYKGGTIERIWRFDGRNEAAPLTDDFDGTSAFPMWRQGRIYFNSDRDGHMNIWSMTPDGGDLRQHTSHVGFDVQEPDLHGDRIVYHLGADIHVLDLRNDDDRVIPIRLDSDFDQMRERWIKKPTDWATSAHVSHDGGHVVLTARGDVFVAPRKTGRIAEITRDPDIRHRDARMLPDGERILTLSDASDEVELWTYRADGYGEPEQLTDDADILRWEAIPSPDGRWIAHHDKDRRLYLYDSESGENSVIDVPRGPWGGVSGLAWSPDSRWLAYQRPMDNFHAIIRIHDTETGDQFDVTTDRTHSWSPQWSADGDWLYFLSDRNLETIVPGPWGLRQPEPFLAKTAELYLVALRPGLRSPFLPDDELSRAEKDDEAKADDDEDAKPDAAEDAAADADEPDEDAVEIVAEGLPMRLFKAPAPPGNYAGLIVAKDRLFITESAVGPGPTTLKTMRITNDDPKLEAFVEGVDQVELSGDRSTLLVRKGDALHLIDASAGAPASLDKTAVDLSGWRFAVTPRDEWRQMFNEAWRLERDYFYDPDMHGVDWPRMREKYLDLVDRVSNRDELSNLIAQMVGELSALHIFVYGGDQRNGDDQIQVGYLGADLARNAQGYRIDRIYESDPALPDQWSPLARPDLDVKVGDVITAVDGRDAIDARDIGELLRNKVGRQTRLRLDRDGESHDVIVEPISAARFGDLRYDHWELERRRLVEQWGDGDIGYVHLRAMGADNWEEWARNFYPVFNRKGLILDVRHNRGGNIDSWILEKLMRKAWFYWQDRHGAPTWNMQYAFRGHIVVLCDEHTASDGEAVTEGVRRLGLGTIIGKRTWGGEIWLSSSNFLVDRGIATAAEFGVFGPEGDWLIEGVGVIPDIEVSNLPHATFNGEDAQLRAGVEHLLRKIEEEPVEDVVVPPLPDKSSPDNR